MTMAPHLQHVQRISLIFFLALTLCAVDEAPESEEAPAAESPAAAALANFVVSIAADPAAKDGTPLTEALLAAARRKGVGRIHLGPGSFRLYETYTGSLVIAGAGSGKTTIHFTAPPDKARQPRRADAAFAVNGGRLEGLSIVVEKPDATGVLVDGRASLEDVVIEGPSTGTGIAVEGRLWGRHVQLRGFNTGLHASSEQAIADLEDLTIDGPAAAGITMDAGVLAVRNLRSAGGTCAITASATA